jgi:phosphoglycerate dehydrogenase-like enzyme
MSPRRIVAFSGSYERYIKIVKTLPSKNIDFVFADLNEVKSFPYEDSLNVVALWVEFTRKIDSHLLEYFPNLLHVFTSTTGVGHIDIGECKRRGINVLCLNNFRHISSEITSTPEFTWLLIMAVWRKFLKNVLTKTITADEIIQLREKNRGFQINDRSIGVIGFGRVGRQIGKYAASFGMRVGYFDIENIELRTEEISFKSFSSIEQLLMESDVIVLAASQSLHSNKIIHEGNFGLIKKGAILINTARGSLWDEKLVLELLEEGRISGVGVDVYEFEENRNETYSPLLECENTDLNLIRTPHIGGATYDAQETVTKKMGLEILEILNRKTDAQ